MARFNMRTCQLAMLPCDMVGESAGIVSSCGQHCCRCGDTLVTVFVCRVNAIISKHVGAASRAAQSHRVGRERRKGAAQQRSRAVRSAIRTASHQRQRARTRVDQREWLST